MKPIKKNIQTDTYGIVFTGPFVLAAIAIAGIIGVGTIAYSQPDVTYNISDTGFSLAGIDMSWIVVIGIAAIIFMIFLFIGKRDRKPQQQYMPYYQRERY